MQGCIPGAVHAYVCMHQKSCTSLHRRKQGKKVLEMVASLLDERRRGFFFSLAVAAPHRLIIHSTQRDRNEMHMQTMTMSAGMLACNCLPVAQDFLAEA